MGTGLSFRNNSNATEFTTGKAARFKGDASEARHTHSDARTHLRPRIVELALSYCKSLAFGLVSDGMTGVCSGGGVSRIVQYREATEIACLRRLCAR